MSLAAVATRAGFAASSVALHLIGLIAMFIGGGITIVDRWDHGGWIDPVAPAGKTSLLFQPTAFTSPQAEVIDPSD